MKVINLIVIFLCGISCIPLTGNALRYVSPDAGTILFTGFTDDTARINALSRKGLQIVSKPGMSYDVKALIDSADAICGKKDIEIPSLLHLLRAEYSFSTGDYTKSSIEALASIEKAESSGESAVLARSLNFMGRYYLRTGFYRESLDHYDKSISVSKKNRLKGLIPRSYDGKAGVYMSLNDYMNFRSAMQSMIDAASEENDSLSLFIGVYRLGTSYADSVMEKRNFTLADSLLRRANKISLIRKDSAGTALSLVNLGWNFYDEKMFDSSLFYYNKALQYSIPTGQYGTSSNAYGNIGTINRDLGKYEESVVNYHKAIDLAKKVNDWYSLAWVYKDMSDLYLRINDTSKAFKSYVSYKQFDDSLKFKERSQGMIDSKVRYDADTHNKEVELLSLRLKNNRILNFGFAVFIILTFTIGLLFLRASKHKERRRISEMNRQISEITQANLRQQMNPHFIFNTLNSIQYYMYQHDKIATNNYLTKFSNLMRKVLENSQHTSIPLSDELAALNLYLELENIRFKDKFEYEIKVEEEIDTLLYKVPAMLIQPYVENSIAHGLMPKSGKGYVKVDIKLEKDYLVCTIEDNGIGRAAAQENIAKKEGGHNSLGTQIVSSRLDLVNALYGTSLKTIYTDLKKENGDPAGTRVEIHIPIMT